MTLGDAEDHVKVILRATSCPVIDIELTRTCTYPQSWWLIMGTQGGLTGSTSSLRWKYFDREDLSPRQIDERPSPDRSYNREDIPLKEETWDLGKDYKSGEYAFYEELYKTLRHGFPLGVTFESVRRVMWVIEKCRESCKP